MKKRYDRLEARREHVSNYVNDYDGSAVQAVENLSNSLFLSESTIWRDLKLHSKDRNVI